MAKKITFGAYAIRIADSPQKSKWHIAVVKSAASAVRTAKEQSKTKKYPVCVFDLSRWSRKPVCFKDGKKVIYYAAPSGLKAVRPAGKLRRLALARSSKMPIVQED